MNELLRLATADIARFLSAELPKLSDDWWQRRVLACLSDQQRIIARERKSTSLQQLDLAALLRIIVKNWSELSNQCGFPREAWNWLKELQTVRNRWAHRSAETIAASEVHRDADTLGRLLEVLGARSSSIKAVESTKAAAVSSMAGAGGASLSRAFDQSDLADRDTRQARRNDRSDTLSPNASSLGGGDFVALRSNPAKGGRWVAREVSKDNQWWYGNSAHRPRVENAAFVVLRIAGRECALQRSEVGRDGRPTHSFKFLDAGDRAFWRALNGQSVDIEVIESRVGARDLEVSCGVDDVEVDNSSQNDRGSVAHQLSPLPVRLRRSQQTMFDEFVFCDWSANSRPKSGSDSIWLCHATFGRDGVLDLEEPHNATTRHAATERVAGWLRRSVGERRRVLVGFDFPYGLPRDAYGLLLGPTATAGDYWRELAQRVTDDHRNANNRFEVAAAMNERAGRSAGPFWGVPAAQQTEWLRSTKPKPPCTPPAELREVERVLHASGRRAFTVWQLLGNGSVGSQSLTGLPRIWQLLFHPDLREHSTVWPFEQAWSDERRPLIVHAEVWPGAIAYDTNAHPIRDAAQVVGLARWAAGQDIAGRLRGWLELSNRPTQVTAAHVEGWILGV